jgi:hypothetical protein
LPCCSQDARRWRADVLRFRILIDEASLICESSQPQGCRRALCFYGTFHYCGGSVEVNEVQKNLT